MRYTKRAAAEKAVQHANEFRDILASHDSRYGPRADANGGEEMSNNILGAETPYGFEWGAAKIERCFSDAKQGWVTMLLTTPKYPKGIQIYITKTGKVRVFGAPGIEQPREWLPVGTEAK